MKNAVGCIALIRERDRAPLREPVAGDLAPGAVLSEIGLNLIALRDIVVEKLVDYLRDV